MSLLKLDSQSTRLAAPASTPRATSPALWAGAGAVGALLVVALVLGVAKGGWSWPTWGPAKVTAVTYVYEKNDGGIPPAVAAALDKLNRRGIKANPFEDDTVNGEGKTPEQYRVALDVSKETGVPVLVVQAGAKVVKAVKKPTKEEDVLGVAP